MMNKVRYGCGSHPWEDNNSPTQMICEEVLSKELIYNEKNKTYCQILRDNNICSNSWNYVYVCNTDWNRAKLQISYSYSLPSFKTTDLESYIKVCHFLPSVLVQSVLAYYLKLPTPKHPKKPIADRRVVWSKTCSKVRRFVHSSGAEAP